MGGSPKYNFPAHRSLPEGTIAEAKKKTETKTKIQTNKMRPTYEMEHKKQLRFHRSGIT